jgi:putative oxidoreductase
METPAMLNGIIPASWSGHLLAALRIMTGLLFLQHGTAKFFKFPLTEYFKDGVELLSMAGLSGALELVGGILIIIGLFTRVTAFVLSGFMAVAYFMAHAPQGFFPINNMGELAIMYCFVFLYLAAAGAGPWSLDANRE